MFVLEQFVSFWMCTFVCKFVLLCVVYYISQNKMLANNICTKFIRLLHLIFCYLFQARLSRCQSWTKLYDSDEHGLSMNR